MATISTETLFLDAIGRHAMIPAGSHVLCAVSGGADSVALLRLLMTHRELLGIGELTACHINHCLRGEESDRDEQFVRDLCSAWDIPLQVRREDAAAYAGSRGLSLEEGARVLRYSVFDALCRNKSLIATAHTLTDSIETLIMNLARGTGITGLTGIPPVRDNIIRPLIGCTRADIEAYLEACNTAYVSDSTNFTDAYTRNRIRHNILPELSRINPAYESAIARTIDLLSQDADHLDGLAEDTLSTAKNGEGYALSELVESGSLLPRLIRAMLHEQSAPVDHKHIRLCTDCILSGSGAVQLGDGYTFYIHQNLAYVTSFALSRRADSPLAVHKASILVGPLTVVVGDSKLTLSVCEYEQMETDHKFSEKSLKNAVDYDKISDILVLRPHKPGDQLDQPGRGVAKSVRKLISEAGIPIHRRSGVTVALSGDRPVWVQGFGHDNRMAPDSDTIRLLMFDSGTWPDCTQRNG